MTKKEMFISAILASLRLEANIYIVGAVENLIDRLDSSDYQTFIAYLGERNSNFEKPIESIAKGVDEFYMLKTKSIREELLEKAKVLETKLSTVRGIYKQHKEVGKEFFISKVKDASTGDNFIDDFELATLKRMGTLSKIFAYRISEYVSYDYEKQNPWVRTVILDAMILQAGLRQSVSEMIESNGAIDNKNLLSSMNIKRIG